MYLVAAGLFDRAIWYFEQQHWNKMVGKDVSELGAGPGSYDISRSVWHVNVRISVELGCRKHTNSLQCCSPEVNGGGGWGIFNGILGWTNSATYSTVISYNLYWLAITVSFIAMRYHEVRGHWPLMRPKTRVESTSRESPEQSATNYVTNAAEHGVFVAKMAM